LIFGSICSGIEAASVAWLSLDWQCSFMSEIEAFPRAVISHHYQDTPLHGDFTTIQTGQYAPIDVLVGGTPCQPFSVTGLRGGMADARGNLALEYLRLAERLRPRWIIWENVPGVLSSAGGRDFGSFLGGLAECGYGWAYRVLDAQYFGLAQRRKRVFVVGRLGDWRRAAAVLFEPESLRGHPAPGREARERVAASLTRGADSGGKGGYAGRRREDDVNLVANPLVTHSLRADGFDASEDGTGRGTPLVACVFDMRRSSPQQGALRETLHASEAGALAPRDRRSGVSAVRRLTPRLRECERLQGFPEIEKSVTILVCCSDRQKTAALAEIQNHRSPPYVWSADESGLKHDAESAERLSSISLLGQEWPVVLNARIDFERGAVAIHSRGRLLWSASDAVAAKWSLPLLPPADFVRVAAPMMHSLVPVTRDGAAASPLNMQPSLPALRGSAFAPVSGSEINALAKDADLFTSAASKLTRSTTSGVGQNSRNSAQTLEIWSCCVAAVIGGFIPEITSSGSSFALNIEGVSGYTAIPYRGKMASDGPRYRALGNSMAVPVMRWIGQRIAMMDAPRRSMFD
jgi:site-specific DNA-cytosine methylase